MRMIAAEKGIVLAPNGRPAFLEAMENNWYEGSRWSPNRSFVWFPVQDAKKDLDRFTRMELSKHARYLYKNSPLIRGLIERLVTLSVGSGFNPVFKSSNAKWNERAKAVWRKKSRNVHLGPKASMMQYQRAVARARFVDGECFSLKTSSDVTFDDRLQGLESERIGGIKGKNQTPENAEFNKQFGGGVDGFNLDAQGSIKSYNIKGVEQAYDAEYITHHYTPNRLGQYRGETILAAAINTARDVDDILALEKECVKDASSKKDIIKTSSGQIDAETFRQLRYGAQGAATPFSLPNDDNTKDDYYRVRFGAQPVVLKKGDEYTPYKPDRPGAAWQGFIDFLSMTICLSSGYPPSVILPISVGGTDIRRDLDIAQKVSDPIQLDLAGEFDELLDYLLQGEIDDGALRADLPDDWMVRAWHFPQKVNVDRQQAQQDREDVAHGLMSLEEYHGRYGMDAMEVEATVLKEAKARKAGILGAGFEDVREFVQVISLDSKMFQTKITETMEPGTEDGAPTPTKKKATAK